MFGNGVICLGGRLESLGGICPLCPQGLNPASHTKTTLIQREKGMKSDLLKNS